MIEQRADVFVNGIAQTEIGELVELEPEDRGCGRALICPSCGSTYLHHGDLTCFDRTREDSDGYAIVVGARDENAPMHAKISVLHLEAEHFPGRRDSVSIRFWCEECTRKSTLVVLQHKGETFLSWNIHPSEADPA